MNTDPSVTRRAARGGPGSRPASRHAGTFIVEFSMVLMWFLLLVFGVLELARAVYVWNTLQEVTRTAAREAAVTDFSDPVAMEALRRRAVFNSAAGRLPFAAPVTANHVVVEYMSLQIQSDTVLKPVAIPTSSMPGSPADNRIFCAKDCSASNCIRMVRVRICQPGTSCTPVPYQTMFPLMSVFTASMTMPDAVTLLKAQSLGYRHGAPRL